MKHLELDDTFEDYMRKTNPSVDPASVQYRESRRVFMAGCASLFSHMIRLSACCEQLGVSELDSIRKQLTEFGYRVGEDKDEP